LLTLLKISYRKVVKLIRENNSVKMEKYFKEEIEMVLLIATGSEVNLAVDEGDVLVIDQFGASAPGERIIKEYGFTVENVVAKVKGLLNK
jgi:transketolase